MKGLILHKIYKTVTVAQLAEIVKNVSITRVLAVKIILPKQFQEHLL